jgi:hypothetical protein
MAYACPAWKFAADSHLMELQSPQNKVLRTDGKLPRNTQIRDMHISFQIPYVHDYITKLCSQQAQVIQHQRKYMFTILDKAKPDIENIRDLKLAVDRHTIVQVIKLVLQPELPLIGHKLLYRAWSKRGLIYVLYIY